MLKLADLRKLDKKHLSPETLGMLISGEMPQLQQALERPDLQFLLAQAKERQRQLFDAIKYPDFYRKPPAERPTAAPNMSPFSPIAPGSPMAPGAPAAPGAPGGIIASAALRDFIMAKAANGGEMGGSEEYVEGQIEPVKEENDSVAKQNVDKLKKSAFKHGFFLKLAECGLKPTEFEELFRLSFDKAAAGAGGAASALTTLTGGALLGKAFDAMGGVAKGVGKMIAGGGKLGLALAVLLPPIVGGIAGGSAYYMTRPDEMSAADIKHMERLALYKRLSRRARSRTRKEEPEAESEKTRGDDAHRKILPMASTPGVEV
jgi:hypothetical protein